MIHNSQPERAQDSRFRGPDALSGIPRDTVSQWGPELALAGRVWQAPGKIPRQYQPPGQVLGHMSIEGLGAVFALAVAAISQFRLGLSWRLGFHYCIQLPASRQRRQPNQVLPFRNRRIRNAAALPLKGLLPWAAKCSSTPHMPKKPV